MNRKTVPAAIVTEDPLLAASLAGALPIAGLAASRGSDVTAAKGEVVVVDAALPGLTPAILLALRCASFVVVVTGWWDTRESELRPHADFVLNSPLREWQLIELREKWERRRKLADKAAVRIA